MLTAEQSPVRACACVRVCVYTCARVCYVRPVLCSHREVGHREGNVHEKVIRKRLCPYSTGLDLGRRHP